MDNSRGSHMMALGLVAVILLLGGRDAFGYAVITNKTDHAELHVVPAPGVVVLAGDLMDPIP